MSKTVPAVHLAPTWPELVRKCFPDVSESQLAISASALWPSGSEERSTATPRVAPHSTQIWASRGRGVMMSLVYGRGVSRIDVSVEKKPGTTENAARYRYADSDFKRGWETVSAECVSRTNPTDGIKAVYRWATEVELLQTIQQAGAEALRVVENRTVTNVTTDSEQIALKKEIGFMMEADVMKTIVSALKVPCQSPGSA